MTSGVGNKSQPLSSQSKRRSRSGAGKTSSRVHPKIHKGQCLISYSSTNTPTEYNMERGKEIIY